jgi:ABC-type uncharacterized transport system substrate-binding protein
VSALAHMLWLRSHKARAGIRVPTVVVAALVLCVLFARPIAEAQQPPKVYRVGFLTAASVPDLLEAFRQGLRELGWTEGQNLVVEYLSADSKLEKVPGLAAELVRTKVDVVVATATAVHEARRALASVPTVFVIADDPVSAGFVASLARPGGRMTGLTSLNVELDAKRLEILIIRRPSPVYVTSGSCRIQPTGRVPRGSPPLNVAPALSASS